MPPFSPLLRWLPVWSGRERWQRGVTSSAIGLILFSSLMFTLLQLELKYLMQHIHPFQAAFYRNLSAWIIVLPFVLHGFSLRRVHTLRAPIHAWRAVVGTGGMCAMFYSFQHLPMAQAVSFSFITPLLATAGAALFLGETVRVRRWAAIGIGFMGTLIMLRPWHGAVHPGMLAALLAAVFVAASTLLIKRMVMETPIRVNLFYMGLFMTPLSLLLALPFWQPLPVSAYPLVGLIGITATISQAAMHRAFALAETSALMPFDYVRLPLAVGLGWWLFGENLDGYTLLGALLILLSSSYVAWRERRLRRSIAPIAAETG